ncbi:MAG TPA: multidrug effflux MFS transporter [Actinomycetales bacterium]|nr:multidrug effflux MFS transporter [Actinomycetales bacterium]
MRRQPTLTAKVQHEGGSSASPGAAEPMDRGRYLQLVLVLGSLIAIGPLTVDMYLPALPSMAADLQATDAAVQATLTGMLVGLGVGQLVVGPVSDAFGRRLPLLVGLTGHVLASVLCAVAPGVEFLTAARAVQGFAGAAMFVVALAIVRDLFTGLAAARLLSRLMLVIGVAPILAPTLGGQLLVVTSWRGIFVALAAIGLVLIAVASLGLRETLPPARRRSARPVATLRTYRWILGDRVFVSLALVGGLMFGAMFAYISGSPFVLQGLYGLDEQTYALVFGANAIGIVAMTQLNPVLLRWWSPRQVLSTAVLIATAASLALVGTTLTGAGGLVGLLVPLFVVISVCGLTFPNVPALALSRHGEAAGTASALIGAAQFGLGGLAAPLVGLLGTSSAVPMAVVMLAVTSAAATLMRSVVMRAPQEAAA